MSMTCRLLRGATAAATALFLVIGPTLAADPLPEPKGRPLLEVTGAIKASNVGDKAVFDLAMLEGLGNTEIVTTTAWTEGKQTFEGVLLSAIIERVGTDSDTAVAIALNDYKVDIPVEDFGKYPVILAYRMNGKELKIRDKGPLWVVYPQDDYPELKNKQTQAKWVWQVKEIHFK